MMKIQKRPRAWLFGFSFWKHRYIRPYFRDYLPDRLRFVNFATGGKELKTALKRGMSPEDRIYIWGRREISDVEAWAAKHDVPLYRVEDGFIRSVGLGSDLTRPYSLVFDRRGIYFDPSRPSDLEHLLQTAVFDGALLERARHLRQRILEEKLSKYNAFGATKLELPQDRKIILVPGQVEDDASIRYGGDGMRNLELLRAVRENAPEAYIVYKPHPDVVAGNRVGRVAEEEALRYCDRVVTDVGIDAVLERADEVHTITSLVGFEALMRGRRVTVYGMPFYAGWGLTRDRRNCRRRSRKLTLDELVAGTLILYPRYLDPLRLTDCGPEETLAGLAVQRERLRHSFWIRRGMILRNLSVRFGQKIFRRFKLL